MRQRCSRASLTQGSALSLGPPEASRRRQRESLYRMAVPRDCHQGLFPRCLVHIPKHHKNVAGIASAMHWPKVVPRTVAAHLPFSALFNPFRGCRHSKSWKWVSRVNTSSWQRVLLQYPELGPHIPVGLSIRNRTAHPYRTRVSEVFVHDKASHCIVTGFPASKKDRGLERPPCAGPNSLSRWPPEADRHQRACSRSQDAESRPGVGMAALQVLPGTLPVCAGPARGERPASH